jgi:serine/threonine protein kinase
MIVNKYTLLEEIGQGEFGSIFKAKNMRTGKMVAIKREPVSTYNLLQKETKVYDYLKGIKGFPQVHWYGFIDSHYYMAMDLLGSSLRRERENRLEEFSLDEIQEFGKQMVERLQQLHSKGLIHRDIKPDNFLFSHPCETKSLYLVDFGFCKKFQDADGNHIPERTGLSLVGTPSYVSIHVERGWEPSRRDDLESVAYILYYLWKGQSIQIGKKEEEMKQEGVPSFLFQYWNRCRSLSFEQTPDYIF